MSTRRIARKLALTILPLLPKEKTKLTDGEVEDLVERAVYMLTEHAQELLEVATSSLSQCFEKLVEAEVDHPDNSMRLDELKPVAVNTRQLRDQYERIEKIVNLLDEALTLPQLALHEGKTRASIPCSKCKTVNTIFFDRADKSEVREFVRELLSTYVANKDNVDDLIKRTKSKWRVDRMVSTDRDILRLACTELFYMPSVPVKVCINEAVELCHRFADAKAAKFINGVLADLAEPAETFRSTGELPDFEDAMETKLT
ncbi:MAG: transcription antitermination factor NusB [Cyanobacteria bacterium]|nr:transcription antitermination factor NusB [Cyanobacteriota bacterium]